MVRVVTITEDFKLAYNLRLALEVSAFQFAHLSSKEELKVDDILVQSRNDEVVEHPRRILLSRKASKSKILSSIFKLMEGEGNIIVGIDPGKTIGIAILQNANVISTSSFRDILLVEQWIKEEISTLSYRGFCIRIGNTGGEYNEPILDYIHKQFHKIARIEIVDETRSTYRTKGNTPRVHENAAIAIAKRNGTTSSG